MSESVVVEGLSKEDKQVVMDEHNAQVRHELLGAQDAGTPPPDPAAPLFPAEELGLLPYGSEHLIEPEHDGISVVVDLPAEAPNLVEWFEQMFPSDLRETSSWRAFREHVIQGLHIHLDPIP
jgi:hypothetical protein